MHDIETINWLLNQQRDKNSYLFNRDRFIPEKHLDLGFLRANGVTGFFKYLDFPLIFETFSFQMFSDSYMALLDGEAKQCSKSEDDRIAYWNARDRFEEQQVSERTSTASQR